MLCQPAKIANSKQARAAAALHGGKAYKCADKGRGKLRSPLACQALLMSSPTVVTLIILQTHNCGSISAIIEKKRTGIKYMYRPAELL